jgi:hypothetical protein
MIDRRKQVKAAQAFGFQEFPKYISVVFKNALISIFVIGLGV